MENLLHSMTREHKILYFAQTVNIHKKDQHELYGTVMWKSINNAVRYHKCSFQWKIQTANIHKLNTLVFWVGQWCSSDFTSGRCTLIRQPDFCGYLHIGHTGYCLSLSCRWVTFLKNPALRQDLECIAKPLDCVWRTKINNLHLKKTTCWINCAAPLWWAPVNKGKSKSSFFKTNNKGWRESREISVQQLAEVVLNRTVLLIISILLKK